MICDSAGGVLDDLIVYRLAAETYMVVANAANAAVVLAEADRAVLRSFETPRSTTGPSSYTLVASGPRRPGILGEARDAPLTNLGLYSVLPTAASAHGRARRPRRVHR